MRVLLDECLPRRLRREWPDHEVQTVTEMGWSGKKNGELLRLMASQRFDVFVTVDRNLRHQQNLRSAGIGLVVLIAASNRIADLRPLAPSVQSALESIAPGDVVEISA
jgi:predicted nuclease of predicted toxin-antitoxin system